MSTELMQVPQTEMVRQEEWSAERVDLLARTVAKGATPDELELFLQVCRRTGLDPFARQIYAIKRKVKVEGTKDQWRDSLVFQTGIDGYRLIAERTGQYDGQDPVLWCGPDGKWADVWLSADLPAAARVGVYRKGVPRPFVAVALFCEYRQLTSAGGLTTMWESKGALMIGKCAEALALRKAFPQELSGVYTHEEMQQADNAPQPPAPPPPAPPKPPSFSQRLATAETPEAVQAALQDYLAGLKDDAGRPKRVAAAEQAAAKRLRELTPEPPPEAEEVPTPDTWIRRAGQTSTAGDVAQLELEILPLQQHYHPDDWRLIQAALKSAKKRAANTRTTGLTAAEAMEQ